MIAVQPVYWRVYRIYRKHSFLYYCVLDRVYRAVAWQRVDEIRYNIVYIFLPTFEVIFTKMIHEMLK
jgi:hypothetical protein